MAAPLAIDLMTFKLSRTREFEADFGAAELTGDPQGLMLALERIESRQGGLWERLVWLPGWLPQRLPSWLSLIRTHPTTAERLARLAELAPLPAVPPLWQALPVLLIPGALPELRRRPPGRFGGPWG
jgi:heat shock protein HtpX